MSCKSLDDGGVGEAFELACRQNPVSPDDAALQFTSEVERLLSEAESNAPRFLQIMATARRYDVVESFAHLGR